MAVDTRLQVWIGGLQISLTQCSHLQCVWHSFLLPDNSDSAVLHISNVAGKARSLFQERDLTLETAKESSHHWACHLRHSTMRLSSNIDIHGQDIYAQLAPGWGCGGKHSHLLFLHNGIHCLSHLACFRIFLHLSVQVFRKPDKKLWEFKDIHNTEFFQCLLPMRCLRNNPDSAYDQRALLLQFLLSLWLREKDEYPVYWKFDENDNLAFVLVLLLSPDSHPL